MRSFYLGIGLLLVAAGCRSQDETAPVQEPAKNVQSRTNEADPQPSTPEPAAQTQPARVTVPGVGSCQASNQVETAMSQLVEHADANHDGEISRKEAESFMNFALGGFFFRADENGDGKVTPEEGREARLEFAAQNPAIAALLQQVQAVGHAGKKPFVRIAEIMNVDYDQPIAAKDVRAAANSALDDLYSVVDKNHDKKISILEARSASVAGAQALGHQVFAAADTNGDGAVELAELEASVDAGVKSAFGTADQNSDGKLTEQEAAAAFGGIAYRLGLPAKPAE